MGSRQRRQWQRIRELRVPQLPLVRGKPRQNQRKPCQRENGGVAQPPAAATHGNVGCFWRWDMRRLFVNQVVRILFGEVGKRERILRWLRDDEHRRGRWRRGSDRRGSHPHVDLGRRCRPVLSDVEGRRRLRIPQLSDRRGHDFGGDDQVRSISARWSDLSAIRLIRRGLPPDVKKKTSWLPARTPAALRRPGDESR